MAIFHCSMQLISRSQGRSATAAAAYRGGYEIEDERTGRTFDYSNRRGVLDDTILAPEQAPDWATNSSDLWNKVELAERRKDAQVARENVIALPHELTQEQNKSWLHAFVQEAFVSRGMAAQVSIHAPGKEGDHRNLHAHVLLTTRAITQDGLADKKDRSWNAKATLQEWREGCARHINQALERAGHKERVDHRSYEDQGKDKMPTQHLGPDAAKMERTGEKTRVGDHNRTAKEFNRVMEQRTQELKTIERLIAEEKKRLSHDSKQVDVRQDFKGASEKAEPGDRKEENQEYDRDTEQIDQEMRIIDASIDHEKERLEAEKREAKEVARAQAETDRILAKHDREQVRAVSERMKRDRFRSELDAVYKRDEVESELKNAEDRLANSNGFFSRLIGRQARCEQEVEALRLNLDSIKQREDEAYSRLERDIAEARKRDGFDVKEPSPTPSPEISKTLDQKEQTGPERAENSAAEGYKRSTDVSLPKTFESASEPISGPSSTEKEDKERESSLSSSFGESAGSEPDQSLVDEILRDLGGNDRDLGGDGIGRGSDGPDR